MEQTALITSPEGIFSYLICLIGFLFWLSGQDFMKKFFHYLPPLIWTYFLPMISTSLGIIPAESPLYRWITRYILPATLVLLLVTADLPAIYRLGFKTITMTLSGTLGIVIGGPVALALFQTWLPEDAWLGVGALAGSWIGGSMNMMAIAEGIGTPSSALGPLIIVDTVVGYSWLGILVFLAGRQNKIDKWFKADRSIVDDLNKRMELKRKECSRPITVKDFSMMLGLAFGVGFVCLQLGNMLPSVGKVISQFTWTIIIVTAVGLALSFTKFSKLEDAGASQVGYVGLYILLASIGARADLRMIIDVPVFMLLGVVWIFIHAVCLFTAAKLLRAPMFFVAAGSMANIGGPASAPVIASIYQSALAPVGLLMAVLGGIVGTYAGLLCAWICSIVGG